MNEKLAEILKKIDVTTVIAYMFAIAIIGTAVFYFPQGFIGFVIGAAFGLNKDELEKKVFNDEGDNH